MKILRTCILALVSLFLWPPPPSHAQERPRHCRPADRNLGTLMEQLDRVAATRTGFDLEKGVMDAFLVVVREGQCPLLAPGGDRVEIAFALLDHARSSEGAVVGAPLVQIVGVWLQRVQRGDPRVREALFRVIREAPTRGIRWQAFQRLTAQLDPAAHRELLEMLRAPLGPPGWEGMPTDLIADFPYNPSPGVQALRRDILAAPEHVQQPLARWILECGQGHAPLRLPEDPCHRSRAPVRVQSTAPP